MFKIGPAGKVAEVKWSKPENFRLETVVPDAKGGLYLVGDKLVLRRAPDGRITTHAKTGSSAGVVALAADGSLYLGQKDRIVRVSPDGRHARKVADGFKDVFGLALDARGNLYAADRKAGKVYRIADGRRTAIATGLSFPSGVVCGDAGELFVKESGRQTHKDMRILNIGPKGKVTVFATVPSVTRFD